MADQLRWGIMGTGNIANQFAAGVAGASRSVVAAVGSRTQASADAFGDKHGIAARHATYDDLIVDSEVDAIYLSMPNAMHHEWTIKALRGGKHVLCEKPIASNAAEAREMFDVAEQEGRLLVEAFMYRSHPMMLSAVDAVRRGEIGELKLIRASFCYRTTKTTPEENVRFSVPLVGGALMDIGCYCLSFARAFAGEEPNAVHGVGNIHDTGVDDYAAGTLTFPSGVIADFACGMTLQANNAALVCGTDGYIEIPVPWKPPVEGATYLIKGQTPPKQDGGGAAPIDEVRSFDAPAPLYGMEADDFAAAVLDGKPVAVTKQDTLGNMVVLDTLRQQIGLSY